MTGEARTPQEGRGRAEDYGAIGDGVTNDTAAVQEAVNAAQHLDMNVETQAWREQVERVQRGLTGGMKDQWKAQKSLDALTAQIEELERERDALDDLCKLLNEVQDAQQTRAEAAERERDFKDEANCDLLERLEYAERDLASSQQAALLLHKRVEEMEVERDHWKWDHQEASKELVVRAEAAERALAQIREARAKLARDPEWPDLPAEC